MRRRGFRCGVLVVPLVLAASGCAGKDAPVPVRGKVTLDGRPVTGAAVHCMREGGNGPPAHAQTQEDGTYQLTTFATGDGALPGDYRVMITWEEPPPPQFRTGDPPPSREEMRKKVAQELEKRKKVKPALIPAVYNDPSKTPLKLHVPPLSGGADFALQSTAR